MPPSPPAFQVTLQLADDGGPAELFLADAPELGRRVAVKVLRAEATSDPGALARFVEQCHVCESLDHPGVERSLGIAKLEDERIYQVTEHAAGASLREQLDGGGPLGVGEALALARALCDALAALHAAGAVHGDVRPGTVLLQSGGGVFGPKLIHIGLGLLPGPRSVRAGASVLPSPAYAAPERIGGRPADAAADLYSLGALLYECAGGAPPFVAADPQGLLEKHLSELPAPLLGPASALFPVILRCLAKRPQDRFQSAQEVALALDDVARDLSHAATVVSGQRPIPLYPPVEEPLRELGGYTIVGQLGEGSMGQVFHACHQRLGRHVAIKLLKPEHARNRDLIERFFQEARAVNQVNHEHIVEIHDFVEESLPGAPDRVYCVMELLSGKTLAELMAEGPLSVQRVVGIARQVCAGLAAAHRVGVVHRDVKPDNIFITERSGSSDYVKLLDFGVAKLISGDKPKGTLAGTVIGTPDYMSPEQAAGAVEVDARSDLWSLGVVLYEMLTGRLPFDAPAFGQLVVDLNTKPAPPLPPSTAGGEPIPAALRQAVMRCLKKDPRERPASMEALDRELELSLKAGGAARVNLLPSLTSPLSPVEPEVGPLPLPESLPEPRPGGVRARAAPGRWLGAGATLAVALGAYGALHPGELPAPLRGPFGQLGQEARDATRWSVAGAQALAAAGERVLLPRPPVEPGPTVGLTVRTLPPRALVSRADTGEPLGFTPLSVRVPRAEQDLSLRITAPGHVPVERVVRPTRDLALDLMLEKAPRRAPARAEAPKQP